MCEGGRGEVSVCVKGKGRGEYMCEGEGER